MGQSIGKLYVHLVFSTKNRMRFLNDEIREELHSYIAGTLKELESPAILINSIEDHIHILFLLSKNYSLAKVVEEIKKGSSKWVKTKGHTYQGFSWQNGYGGFSVSQSNVDVVEKYIQNQKEHHRIRTFEEEFITLLKKHQVEYDERYVFD